MNTIHLHIQSMLWVTDLIGLRIIENGGCLYDCASSSLTGYVDVIDK